MEFDYYIEVKKLLPKISKLKHYKGLKHKREYLNSMKKLFARNEIESYLLKHKIRKMRDNLEIYNDIIDIVKRNHDKVIFISVDDKHHKIFEKLIHKVNGKNVKIEREGKLKKGSAEYKMSLVIDTKLNLERRKQK
jgi:hypothetical protein